MNSCHFALPRQVLFLAPITSGNTRFCWLADIFRLQNTETCKNLKVKRRGHLIGFCDQLCLFVYWNMPMNWRCKWFNTVTTGYIIFLKSWAKCMLSKLTHPLHFLSGGLIGHVERPLQLNMARLKGRINGIKKLFLIFNDELWT